MAVIIELSCPLSPICTICESPELSKDVFFKFHNSSCLEASYICDHFGPASYQVGWKVQLLQACAPLSLPLSSPCPRSTPCHVLQDLHIGVASPPCSISSISEAQMALSPHPEHLCLYLNGPISLILTLKFITESTQTNIILFLREMLLLSTKLNKHISML